MPYSSNDFFEQNQENKDQVSLPVQKQLFESTHSQNFQEDHQEEKSEELLTSQIKKILYQENISDDDLIFQILHFFEEHKTFISLTIIRNTFALIMSLYGIENVEDLKRCMDSAYDEGPSQGIARQIEKTKSEIIELFSNSRKVTSSLNEELLKKLLTNLVTSAIQVAPHLHDEQDLSLRYKVVTSFIGKILGHMGQSKVDMLLGLIRGLFPELEEKTAQVFGSDIWYYANGIFKKKNF